MSGYDEAVDWFRADPGRVRDLDDVDNRSAAITLVNAALADTGRPITAADVDEAILTTVRPPDGRALQSIADYLNRIARGAPERGDDERYCPQCDSGGHECSGCGTSITHESGRACAACVAGSLPAMPPEVTEALGYFRRESDALHFPTVTRDARLNARTVVRWAMSLPGTGERAASEQGPCAENVPGCTRLRSHTHTPIKVARAASEQDEHRDWVSGVGRHDPMSQPPDDNDPEDDK